MKYFVLLLMMSIFCAAETQAYTVTTYSPAGMSGPVTTFNNSGYNSYPKVSQIESILLNRTYENDGIDSRLSRLEQKRFKRTYPSSDLSWRVNNLFANVDQTALYGIDAKELNSIEKKVLGRTFSNDTLENRLARVEQQVFGEIKGGKIDERFATIRTASTHYSNYSNGVGQTVSSVGNGSGFKNSLQNFFGNMIGNGYMTGYTPPVSPYGYNAPYGFNNTYGNGSYNPYTSYNNYNNNLGNYGGYGYGNPYGAYSGNYNPYGSGYGNSGIRRSVRTRTGWYDSNKNVGSGCGVHILD